MKQRGAALLLVLWLVAMLTALVGAFALTARVEALQGRVLGDGARAQELARAGLEYALVRVADPQPATHWRPDGRPYRWHFADSEIEVRIVDESGKIDLNQATPTLLASLLRVRGVEPERAGRIAAAIADWRDADPLAQPGGGGEDPDYAAAGLPYGAKDMPFETVAEVEQVLGMTPEIFAALQPYLTIHAGRGVPDPAFAPGPVLAAMGLDPNAWLARRQPGAAVDGLVGPGSGTYSVESRARLPGDRVAVLRSVVRAGGGPIPGSTYTALRWDESLAPR
ncbi:type II secretion system protein GspK [Pseudoxanthomonas sangjuensis]|uniref:general secretion pathway protein GspK n=1 Tax=Pseudoxanthomonas sangjuensis TaxID=1503750 RepID=UPI0013913791|nr:type II secretion system protein GspK [Pseudoxanthomonas sangjuensis]KAF1708267.1 general secretion pathway protein GspK [Pseudoxanthomonas sangjuensis]